MPQNRFIQHAMVLAVATWITGVVHAAPVSAPFSASVTVLQQVEIKEDFNLSFGKIDKPRTGTQSFQVLADGNTTVTGGGVGGSFIGGHRAGQYDILGSANNAAVLITSGADCSDTSIELTGVTIELPPRPRMLPIMDAKLGGTLRVSASSNPGNHTCPYSITAQYQ
ncbi:MAG: DUF4402 domain-containing protein [Gammaproteobacteria bacterium]|nr:DUF4402 domain-containing protein [Gammaproteobacteria bacterium]